MNSENSENLTIHCENKNLIFEVFSLTLAYISDDRSNFCLTPVSAMVSMKISRGKFPLPRPGTNALLALLRLTAVKLGGSLLFYNLGILGLTRKSRKCDAWHKVRNETEYGRKYSHIFLTLPSPHPLSSFLPCFTQPKRILVPSKRLHGMLPLRN